MNAHGLSSNECDRGPHGHRTQRRAIAYILKEMDLFSMIVSDSAPVLQPILEDCHKNKCPDVNVRTLRRWWDI